MDMREIIRGHIKVLGSLLVLEAFSIISAFSTLYLHIDPLNKLERAVMPYLMQLVAQILSAF